MEIKHRYAYTTGEDGLVKNGLWLTNDRQQDIDGGYRLSEIHANLQEQTDDEQEELAQACQKMKDEGLLLNVTYIYAGIYGMEFDIGAMGSEG